MTLTMLSSLGKRLGMVLGSELASSLQGSLNKEMNFKQFSAFSWLSYTENSDGMSSQQ